MKFNAISGESFTSTRSTSHNNINKKFQWSDNGDGSWTLKKLDENHENTDAPKE